MKLDDNDVEEISSEESSSLKDQRVVDEVNKRVIHVHKKDKSHIGEEAFLPISLEVLRDTLNHRH